MLIRIISLVFLLTHLITVAVISAENNDFIYPLSKPSVFKKINLKDQLLKKEIVPKKNL